MELNDHVFRDYFEVFFDNLIHFLSSKNKMYKRFDKFHGVHVAKCGIRKHGVSMLQNNRSKCKPMEASHDKLVTGILLYNT